MDLLYLLVGSNPQKSKFQHKNITSQSKAACKFLFFYSNRQKTNNYSIERTPHDKRFLKLNMVESRLVGTLVVRHPDQI